jgi:hypothetical protein
MSTNCVYTTNSRYTNGGTTEVEGNFVQWWERNTFTQDASDLIYVLERRYEGRPDMLASVFYNDSSLWWVILQFNNILDINEEFVVGTQLRIPTLERVQKDFLNGVSGGVPSTAVSPPVVLPIVH